MTNVEFLVNDNKEPTSVFNPDITAIVAISTFNDSRATVANDVFTLLSSEGDAQVTRAEVRTKAFNACHNSLAFTGKV